MELMNFYKENKVNPAGGCLPLLIQMPILFSLIYVIGKPLTYMLGMSQPEIDNLLASVPESQKIAGYYNQIGAVNFHHTLNMNFLGLNLGMVPTWHVDKLFGTPDSLQYIALLIVPLLAVVTTYISIKLSTPNTQPSNSNDASMQNSMQKSMSLMMPAMTLLFSFQFPAGLGIYWIIGNIIQTFQQLYINKYILKKKEVVKK
jgi:YidC/Oxa1 family membrane protein insertase